MRFYNRNGILYITYKGKRISSKLEYNQKNINLLKKHYENEDFINKFNIKKNKLFSIVEYIEKYINEKEKKLKPNTIKTYLFILNKHIKPYFKSLNYYDIDYQKLKDFYNSVNNQQILNICINPLLKKSFNLFLQDGNKKENIFIIDKNIYNSKIKEIEIFTLKEIDILLNESNNQIRNIIAFLFFTGARINEILALTPNDIDIINNTITINKSFSNNILTTPKSKTSSRTIDMLGNLEFYYYEQMKLINKNSKYLFLNSKNKHFEYSVFFYHYKKYLYEKDIKYKSIHTFRHTFASLLLSSNESIYYVSKQLGHSDINITFSKYSHFINSEKKKKSIFDTVAQNKHI